MLESRCSRTRNLVHGLGCLSVTASGLRSYRGRRDGPAGRSVGYGRGAGAKARGKSRCSVVLDAGGPVSLCHFVRCLPRPLCLWRAVVAGSLDGSARFRVALPRRWRSKGEDTESVAEGDQHSACWTLVRCWWYGGNAQTDAGKLRHSLHVNHEIE